MRPQEKWGIKRSRDAERYTLALQGHHIVAGKIRTYYGRLFVAVYEAAGFESVTIAHERAAQADGSWQWQPGPGVDREILERFWPEEEWQQVAVYDGGNARTYSKFKWPRPMRCPKCGSEDLLLHIVDNEDEALECCTCGYDDPEWIRRLKEDYGW